MARTLKPAPDEVILWVLQKSSPQYLHTASIASDLNHLCGYQVTTPWTRARLKRLERLGKVAHCGGNLFEPRIWWKAV